MQSEHLKNQYKDKKDWKLQQSRGNLLKIAHYNQIDAVLVAILVDFLYLFSISYFNREDAYSTYSPFGYALQHPLQHSAYNQQFLPNIRHQYYGPAISSLQMMAKLFPNSPAHAPQTSTTNATKNEDSEVKGKKSGVTHKEGSFERIF